MAGANPFTYRKCGAVGGILPKTVDDNMCVVDRLYTTDRVLNITNGITKDVFTTTLAPTVVNTSASDAA